MIGTPNQIKEQNISRELGYIVGAILGDGWIEKDKFTLQVTDEDFAYYFLEYCKKQFGINPIFNHFFKEVHFKYKNKEMVEYYRVRVNSRSAVRYIKQIIPLVLEQNFEFQKGFLSGFSDAEGTVAYSIKKQYKHRFVDIANSNEQLIKTVCQILTNLGFEYCINNHRGGSKWPKSKSIVIYRYIFLKKFHEDIGFKIKRKQDRLQLAIESYSEYGKLSNKRQYWDKNKVISLYKDLSVKLNRIPKHNDLFMVRGLFKACYRYFDSLYDLKKTLG
jgi:intein-encoded DNA endonuclease-like protein